MFDRTINDELWMLSSLSETKKSRIITLITIACCALLLGSAMISTLIRGTWHDYRIVESIVSMIMFFLFTNVCIRLYGIFFIYPKKQMWNALQKQNYNN